MKQHEARKANLAKMHAANTRVLRVIERTRPTANDAWVSKDLGELSRANYNRLSATATKANSALGSVALLKGGTIGYCAIYVDSCSEEKMKVLVAASMGDQAALRAIKDEIRSQQQTFRQP